MSTLPIESFDEAQQPDLALVETDGADQDTQILTLPGVAIEAVPQAPSRAVVTSREREGEDSVRQYLNEIGLVPLLTGAEEVALAQSIERGREAEVALETARRAAQKRQHRQTVREGNEAADRFTRANLRLVVSIASKYQHPNMQLMDLVQEGNIGLMRAVDKFDWRKGFKFSTYATWWIRQAIGAAIESKASGVHVPARGEQDVFKVRNMLKEILDHLGEEPSVSFLAEQTGVLPDRVQEILAMDEYTMPLEQSVAEGSKATVGDFMPDVDSSAAVDAVPFNVDRQMILDSMLEQLNQFDETERYIAIRYFGLDGSGGVSFPVVGGEIDISPEQARARKNRVVQELRQFAEEQGMSLSW